MNRLLFLLFTAPLAAQSPQAQVRAVTFEKTGAATSLAAAEPGCDEALFAALAADAAAGKAARVFDQTMTIRGGQRSKVFAGKDLSVPDETKVDLENWFVYPQSFTGHVLGQILEAEVTIGDKTPERPSPLLDINLAVDHPALLMEHAWPVPDFRGAGQMGRMIRPVIGQHQVQCQALTCTGRTLLVAVSSSPSAALTAGKESPFCYTFLRAGVDGEKPVAAEVQTPEPAAQQRLHVLTFRLKRDEAAVLMLQSPAGGDRALLDAVKQLMGEGRATLRDHSTVMVRSGQRSKVTSFADFEGVTESRRLIPTAWQQQPMGNTLELEWERGDYAKKKCAYEWNSALSSSSAPELVPLHPSAKQPALHGAVLELLQRELAIQAVMPPGGVLWAGVTSDSPAAQDEGDAGAGTDITFFLGAASPEKAPAHTSLQAVMLSVPAGAGADIQPGTAAGPLLASLTAGDCYCAAHAGLAAEAGARSRVSFVRKIAQPAVTKAPAPKEDTVIPDGWKLESCGMSLTAEAVSEGDTVTATVGLDWDTAPPLGFGEPGAVIPKIEDRRCEQRILLKDRALTRGQAVVADVRLSNARPGTPEHGRRHVLVLLAR